MIADPIPDVIVLIPGILGSVLQRDGKDIWAISGGGIGRALASGWDSIQSLALKSNDAGDDGVTAPRRIDDVHLTPWLWKIDGYTKIRRAITSSFQDVKAGRNYFESPYDGPRDNRLAAHRLQKES